MSELEKFVQTSTSNRDINPPDYDFGKGGIFKPDPNATYLVGENGPEAVLPRRLYGRPLRQPIETAPKNGTPILLFGGSTDETDECEQPNGYENRPVVGVWIDGEWRFAFWDGAWRSTYMNPTQWMPLSELPAE